MTDAAIENAIPHRAPMLLVDEIVEFDERRIVCRKEFRAEEFFFQGHYPDFPLVPGVILCESALQAGGVLLAKLIGADAGVPVVTRLNNVRFRRMVRPGDTIELDVELTEQVSSAYFLKARVRCGGKVAASFDFACTLTNVNG